MLHKEGYKILVNTLLILLGVNLLAMNFLPEIVFSILLVISITIFILITQFFRNPSRNTKYNDNEICSSVDGKVVVIEEVEETEYFKDKRLQISVFMSPLNVHVTRYPMAGKVLLSKYHPGKYLAAWLPKSSTENERTTVVVENQSNKEVILFRQVAGAMARRIVNYAEEGQVIVQGSDSGFIKFGSRVDIYLPLDAKVKVEMDQKVRGGETVLAEF
ncbi:MAG: phosphatidylserine decarboxylase family protein [Flavobacteriales bacterium]|nr:phosphatidylserine decarboxylase family protein [Flavobacteriales bacterium]